MSWLFIIILIIVYGIMIVTMFIISHPLNLILPPLVRIITTINESHSPVYAYAHVYSAYAETRTMNE